MLCCAHDHSVTANYERIDVALLMLVADMTITVAHFVIDVHPEKIMKCRIHCERIILNSIDLVEFIEW